MGFNRLFLSFREAIAGFRTIPNINLYPLKKEEEKYVLSKEQEEKLSELHIVAQERFRAFVIAAEKKGWEVIITSAYRSFAKQKALKDAGETNTSAGYSLHNYGLAADINLFNPKNGKQLKKASLKEEWLKTGIPQIGVEMGFRWGGDFIGQTAYDPVHFDLGNLYHAADLYLLAIQQFGTDVDVIKGNKTAISKYNV